MLPTLISEVEKDTGTPNFYWPTTALHHSKAKATYKKIVDAVTSVTPGLAHKAESFITDGELPLHESLEEGLTKAKGLRCFVHFQRNCVDKRNSLGINQKAEQRFFTDARRKAS